jgi:hypothetical protein
MELLQGQTLKHVIQGKSLDIEEVLDLGVQVADAAAYSGRLEKAREFSRQAVVARAVRADEKESAANVEAEAAGSAFRQRK